MTNPPACAEVRALLADHLDGLLERADAERVEAHLSACATCALAAEHARGLQRSLSTPWAVAEAPGDLPQRARTAFERTTGPRARAATALRYAATFAAGVLVTLIVLRPETASTSTPPVAAAAPAPEPVATASTDEVDVFSPPRRIR